MKNGMLVEAEIWTLVPTAQGNAVFVKPLNSDLAVPIVIGQPEAHAIFIGMGGFSTFRPLTHDLIITIMEKLDAVLEKVEITDLREGTFYSRLTLRQDGKKVTIDARPSDALSLAARLRCPIYIAEPVIQQAGVPLMADGEAGSGPEPRRLEISRLQAELEKALETENYEEAARLRDRLRELGHT